MVDGVCLKERGKFEGKSEVSLPSENTDVWGGPTGPRFHTAVASGREADVFFEA